jgi:hypothetical protein
MEVDLVSNESIDRYDQEYEDQREDCESFC